MTVCAVTADTTTSLIGAGDSTPAEVHRLMLPVSRRNSEDSIASALSDAETELKQEDPPWAGDAMAPMSSLELSNLRRFLLGLEQLKASIESALGADYEAEEGGQDKESAESDCSSDGEDRGHSWTDSGTISTDHGLLKVHEVHDVSRTNHAELARASAEIQSALQPCYSSKAPTKLPTLRRFLLGLEQLEATNESALGADYEAEEGGGTKKVQRAIAQVDPAIHPRLRLRSRLPCRIWVTSSPRLCRMWVTSSPTFSLEL